MKVPWRRLFTFPFIEHGTSALEKDHLSPLQKKDSKFELWLYFPLLFMYCIVLSCIVNDSWQKFPSCGIRGAQFSRNRRWMHSGVQWRLTASTDLCVNRRHTPHSCGYDVGRCCSKSKSLTFANFFLHFSYTTLSKRITSTLAVWAPFGDFRLRATLANGDVWRHIKFNDLWLLWQPGLRVDLYRRRKPALNTAHAHSAAPSCTRY